MSHLHHHCLSMFWLTQNSQTQLAWRAGHLCIHSERERRVLDVHFVITSSTPSLKQLPLITIFNHITKKGDIFILGKWSWTKRGKFSVVKSVVGTLGRKNKLNKDGNCLGWFWGDQNHLRNDPKSLKYQEPKQNLEVGKASSNWVTVKYYSYRLLGLHLLFLPSMR